MSVEFARRFLFWCAVVNYGVLLAWFLAFVLAHEEMLRLHSTWFHLSREQFDALHYGGMAIYKVGILLFNLVPWFVLRVILRNTPR
jgi:hypothetical protein